jgi:hypothetical protein
MVRIKKRVVEYYSFYCHGCKHEHSYAIADENPQWQFNGNLQNPTFTPSLLNTMPVKNEVTGIYDLEKERCHLNVTDGKIIYHKDCKHELAGQTVELAEILPECLHNQYCDMQTTDMHCKSNIGCNFKS